MLRQQRQASQYFRVFRDPASDALVEQFGLGGVLLKAFGESLEGEGGKNTPESSSWLDKAKKFFDGIAS